MKKRKCKAKTIFLRAVCLMFPALIFPGCKSTVPASVSSQPATRVITDMANRKDTVPANITRISVVHPIPCQMVWRLAPQKLASVDKQFDERLEFFPDREQSRLKALPVTGEFHSGLSAEQIFAAAPQVVVSLTKDTNLETEQKSFRVPVVAVSKDTLHDIADSWRLIGKLVGNEKGGNELGDYWDKTVRMVTDQTDKIPKSDRLKVYYAQSPVMNTVGPKTIMASIIHLAGGISLMEAEPPPVSNDTNESIPVSMEKILQWNPDVILTKDAKGRSEILSSGAWKETSAVKSGRVYASLKYEMLDRTQSLMGLLWTAQTLYPGKMNYNLRQEVKKFYSKVYLDNSVTDREIGRTS